MIYLVTLEPLENRYTAQWLRWFKEELPDAVLINGETFKARTPPKFFLDPCGTNVWKAKQIEALAKLEIADGDVFFFFDAWHPGVLTLRYTAELLGKKIFMLGFWHAGTYTPGDLLYQLNLGRYFRGFEFSLLDTLDVNIVATKYHADIIYDSFRCIPKVWGMPYKTEELDKFKDLEKEDLVVFPHRLAPEKNPDLFREIAKRLEAEGIKTFICQEHHLTKDEYHIVLARAKVCLSLAEEETFGIATFEAAYLEAIPVVPNHLSYPELYYKEFRYEPELIYGRDVAALTRLVTKAIRNYKTLRQTLKVNVNEIIQVYINRFWEKLGETLQRREYA